MEVKVAVNMITIKDEKSGEEYRVKSLRSAAEIADYIQESEKDEIVSRLEEKVIEVLNQ